MEFSCPFPIYFNVNYWNKIEFYVKYDYFFSILKWIFQNINCGALPYTDNIIWYWNKMEFYVILWTFMQFYVKFAIFSILKWNFQNINTVIVGLYPALMTSFGDSIQSV